jgi:hypothetical protein
MVSGNSESDRSVQTKQWTNTSLHILDEPVQHLSGELDAPDLAIDALDLIGQHGTRDQESVRQSNFERAAKFMIAKAAVIKVGRLNWASGVVAHGADRHAKGQHADPADLEDIVEHPARQTKPQAEPGPLEKSSAGYPPIGK